MTDLSLIHKFIVLANICNYNISKVINLKNANFLHRRYLNVK